jgi:hypothetical protein
MVVRLVKKCSVLPAVCLSLAWFAAGCDSSSTNESGSSGAKPGSGTAPAADSPPQPKTIKDFYEQQQAKNKQAAPADKSAPKAKGESK